MNAFTNALDAILAANLPTATEVTAIRLLAEANKTYGQYNCTWEAYLVLCNCTHRGAAQRHLTRLSKAKIIHYSTNDRVYITFWAWLDDGGRAESARGRAETVYPTRQNGADDLRIVKEDAPNLRVDAPNLRVDAPNLRATYTHAPAQGWVELSRVDPDLDPDQVIPNPTQPPPPAEEQAWTVGLLTDPDVDMQRPNAQRIAELHTPLYVVRHVATWWDKRTEESAGVLVYRLLRTIGKSKPRAHFSDAFLASDYWQRQYERARHLPLLAGLPPPKGEQPSVWQGILMG